MTISVYQSSKRAIRRSRRLARATGSVKQQFAKVSSLATPLVAAAV